VEAHGGQIQAARREKGTVFEFTLPVTVPAEGS
jgi:signal transduction histidine kinase